MGPISPTTGRRTLAVRVVRDVRVWRRCRCVRPPTASSVRTTTARFFDVCSTGPRRPCASSRARPSRVALPARAANDASTTNSARSTVRRRRQDCVSSYGFWAGRRPPLGLSEATAATSRNVSESENILILQPL